MYIGGILIKNFDGFRRLVRRAAVDYGHDLTISDEDMMLCNRILAGLGGPPAKSEIRGRFDSDGLPTLLLFLLTQEMECRVGLIGDAEPVMAKLKSLVHLFGQYAYPMINSALPLAFQDVVKELGPSGATLKPLVTYDEDGEPAQIEAAGARGLLRIGADGGPYTLAVLLGAGTGPAPVAKGDSPMHPAVLIHS